MLYRSLLCSLLLSFSGLLAAQDYQKHIEADFKAYWQLLIDGEYDAAMDYVEPKLFEIAPREMMVSFIKQTFESPMMDIEFGTTSISGIESAQQVEGKHYVLVNYLNLVKMHFPKDEETSEGEYKSKNALIEAAFKQKFGSDRVTFEEETGFFTVEAEKQLYAISEDGKSNWKFLVFEQENKAILEAVLPRALLED